MSDADLLREIRDDIAELREIVGGRRLSESEQALLDRALPVVYRVTHGRLFAASDLLEFAQSRTADATALREALGIRSARQVGKLLARARGCTIGGYRVRRECDDAGMVLWVCLQNKA